MNAQWIRKDPVFITQTITVGKTPGHTDVTLWYVLSANAEEDIVYDAGEFNGYKWFDFDEILHTDISTFDQHIHRFTKKLISGSIIKSLN